MNPDEMTSYAGLNMFFKTWPIPVQGNPGFDQLTSKLMFLSFLSAKNYVYHQIQSGGLVSLKARILQDMRNAMKAGDHHRRRVTKMLLSEISYAETTAHSDQEIDETTAQNMICRYYERMQKSLEGLPEGEKRRDTLKCLNTVSSYLPQTESDTVAETESTPDLTTPLLQAL